MQHTDGIGNRCDEFGTRAKTVVAQLLRGWTLADRSLGHPAWKEYADGHVESQPVELWPDQPIGVPLRFGHDPDAIEFGELVYLERRADGAVYGVFHCRPGFTLDGVAAVMRAAPCCSISVQGALTAIPLGTKLLRAGELDHVALVDRSAAGTSPAKEAIGTLDEGVGAPKSFTDYEKALLRRAARRLSITRDSRQRSGARLPIAHEPGPAARLTPTPTPQPAGHVTHHPAVIVRRTFPNARLTVR